MVIGPDRKGLDPETAVVENAEEVRAVAEAAETARRDEALLAERNLKINIEHLIGPAAISREPCRRSG